MQWGDAYTLHALKTRFEKGPVDRSAQEVKADSDPAAKAVTKSD
jgi:hypothetical protein